MILWKYTARLVLVALAIFAVSPAAHAGKFGVRVLDAQTGLPVADASVCIGTAGDRNLYGTRVTTPAGMALYENVPATSVLVTVSKKNYRGIALINPATDENVIADVLLTEGISSRKCRALKYVNLEPGITNGDSQNDPQDDWPLEITALSYFPSGNDGFAFLSYSRGKPTHYRISTDPEFRNVEWLDYSDIFQYSPVSTDVGKGVLYFQLRKEIEASGGVIEAFSEVISQTVNL